MARAKIKKNIYIYEVKLLKADMIYGFLVVPEGRDFIISLH